MKIDTDLVKNRCFSNAIKPSLLKYSTEYKVLAVLRYFYPEKYNTMIHCEAPDLQDTKHSIGIEVTNAIYEKDAKASRVFSELNNNNSQKAQKDKVKIESCGYSFLPYNGSTSIGTTGTADGEKLIFQGAITNKLGKLCQYKDKYEEIGLAIVLPEIPTSYAEDHFISWIIEIINESENSFDFYYVISNRFCSFWNYRKKHCTKNFLTAKESERLCTIARMTAEGELSLNDLEWQ